MGHACRKMQKMQAQENVTLLAKEGRGEKGENVGEEELAGRPNHTCLIKPQSTYTYRAPQCMSPRWKWDSPTPLAASECALPPGPKGGGHTRLRLKGWGRESQFQRLDKRLALCLLCAPYSQRSRRGGWLTLPYWHYWGGASDFFESRVLWAPNGTRLSARCHFTGLKKLSISRA